MSLAIQYPPAIIVAESAKMQREEAGDGVATFVVFLSALLKKADDLLTMGIHPNMIIHGYSLAANKSLEMIDAASNRLRQHKQRRFRHCRLQKKPSDSSRLGQ